MHAVNNVNVIWNTEYYIHMYMSRPSEASYSQLRSKVMHTYLNGLLLLLFVCLFVCCCFCFL